MIEAAQMMDQMHGKTQSDLDHKNKRLKKVKNNSMLLRKKLLS